MDAKGETTHEPRCEHDFNAEMQREVRYCRNCQRTEIQSLADLRWYPYISGSQIVELQEQADLAAGLRAWKDAVEDAAVVHWTLNDENANDPRKAVADLIAMVQRMDFDPAISEVAAKAELGMKLYEDVRQYDPARVLDNGFYDGLRRNHQPHHEGGEG